MFLNLLFLRAEVNSTFVISSFSTSFSNNCFWKRAFKIFKIFLLFENEKSAYINHFYWILCCVFLVKFHVSINIYFPTNNSISYFLYYFSNLVHCYQWYSLIFPFPIQAFDVPGEYKQLNWFQSNQFDHQYEVY